MNDTSVERRLTEAFADVKASVVEHPDLFARVQLTIEEDRSRRRFRLRVVLAIAGFVLANALLGLALSVRHEGSLAMPWWAIEVITNIVLVSLAITLGPFIKRFGRAYAADVFRANPRTGKSYLVLTDVAYYLIFTAFILFTITFVEPGDWVDSVGNQLKHEVARVGGILLIMGVLHAANVVALPVIGRLLTNTRRGEPGGRAPAASTPTITTPPLGPGTWILRIEPTEPTGEPPAER